jgi:hypothetical protein
MLLVVVTALACSCKRGGTAGSEEGIVDGMTYMGCSLDLASSREDTSSEFQTGTFRLRNNGKTPLYFLGRSREDLILTWERLDGGRWTPDDGPFKVNGDQVFIADVGVRSWNELLPDAVVEFEERLDKFRFGTDGKIRIGVQVSPSRTPATKDQHLVTCAGLRWKVS